MSINKKLSSYNSYDCMLFFSNRKTPVACLCLITSTILSAVAAYSHCRNVNIDPLAWDNMSETCIVTHFCPSYTQSTVVCCFSVSLFIVIFLPLPECFSLQCQKPDPGFRWKPLAWVSGGDLQVFNVTYAYELEMSWYNMCILVCALCQPVLIKLFRTLLAASIFCFFLH